MDAQIRRDGGVFLCRVAAVVHDDGSFLLHRRTGDDYWAFSGGRLVVGETLEAAVVREMKEETNASTDVVRLLWIVENFFTEQEHGLREGPVLRHHELGFYFLVRVSDALRELSGSQRAPAGIDAPHEFRWFTRAEIKEIDLRPRVIEEALSDLSAAVRVLANHDEMHE